MISVVIRCKNELQSLKEVVNFYREQPFEDYDILIVDNDSSDGTREYCKSEDLRYMNIPDEKFTHAYSCNKGLEEAKHDIVFFTNAHSLPVSERVLEELALRMEEDLNLVGAYGRWKLSRKFEDSNLIQKWAIKLDNYTWPEGYTEVGKNAPGLMQTTCSAVRKSKLGDLMFENMVTGGGEDMLLGIRLLEQGHKIMYLPALNIYHKHDEGNLKTLWRYIRYVFMGIEVKIRTF
jgi:glycosyltransferase involved in cell wall biosynthesis